MRNKESAKNNQIGVARRIGAKVSRQKLYNPKDLIDPRRLDIAAKTVFARAYIEKNTSVWPEELYREHIRSWNGFYEENPKKHSYKDFKQSFINIIESTISGTMNHRKSPVSLDREGVLENGAHRVSAAIIADKFVNTYVTNSMQAGRWDHTYFKDWANSGAQKGLAEKYIDAMTVEYVSLMPHNMFAVIIFPSAVGYRDQVDERIHQLGNVLNVKEIHKKDINSEAVIRQLYAGEWWNNDEHLEDVKNKAAGCFSGSGTLKIYIIRSPLDESQRRKEKETLRDVWGVANHSIHISDTIEEAHRITRMFFNQQSRAVLSVKKEKEFPLKFGKMFRHLQEVLPADIELSDRICIDSGSVLAVLGIRDTDDIDYLSRLDNPLNNDKDIHNHNEFAEYYNDTIDEIITNPTKHFYYNSIKFASLDVIRTMKINRNEEKDRKDIELIDKFIRKNKKFDA